MSAIPSSSPTEPYMPDSDMQPSPIADTSIPEEPSLRFWIALAISIPFRFKPALYSLAYSVPGDNRYRRILVLRFQFYDFRAVIVAGPERDRVGRIIDEDAADIGRPRQQILDRAAAPPVEPQHAIARHAAAP